MNEGLGESGERPARIEFAGGGPARAAARPGAGGYADPEDDIQVLEEDLTSAETDLEPPSRPASKAKPAGIPKWVFAVAAVVLVFVVVGAGMMVMLMRDRWAAADEVLPLPQAGTVPQPAMQQDSAVNAPPAVMQAQVSAAQAAEPPPPHPQSHEAVPPPPVATPSPQPAAPAQAPVQVSPPAPASAIAAGADPAKVAVLEAELVKALGKLDDLGKRLAKMEAALATAAQKPAETKPQPAAKPVAAPTAPKPAPAPVKPAPAPVAKPMPVAAKAAPAKVAPEPAVETAPAPPARLGGYSVSSMIGTRAWLVKRNPDGSEVELSVAPGEKIEGRAVTSVDGNTRCVTVEGGQKICVGK